MEGRKIFLHYVGRGVYTLRSFRAEAKRLGVNRAVASFMLKFIRPNDIVLLGFHKVNRKTNKKKAEVFGYFIVRGLSLPSHLVDRLAEEGLVEKHDTAPVVVERGCGVYVLSGFYNPKKGVSMEQIFDRVAEIGKEEKVGNIFVTGEFYQLPEIVEIPNLDHTRGYINLTEDILADDGTFKPKYVHQLREVLSTEEQPEPKKLAKALRGILKSYRKVVQRKKGEKKVHTKSVSLS